MNPNPQRISQALDARSLYGPRVDEALGVQEPEVDLWETGEIIPTKAQVRRLALLTAMPVEFFYKQPTGELKQMFICAHMRDRSGGGW